MKVSRLLAGYIIGLLVGGMVSLIALEINDWISVIVILISFTTLVGVTGD